MRAGLKITVVNENKDRTDGFIEFCLEASNGACMASQQFYAQADGFKRFADQLKDFPVNINSRVKLEFGGPGKPWATYLLLEVYCFEPTGKSAIKVILETHFIEPHYDKSEFFIICYPASLNILGAALGNWDPLAGDEFEWQAWRP